MIEDYAGVMADTIRQHGAASIPPVHDNSDYKGYSSTIPIARFIDAILEPGKVINWNGKSVKLPPPGST